MKKKNLTKRKQNTSTYPKKFAIAIGAIAALLLIALSLIYLKNSAESNKTANDIAEVLRWEDRTITEKYPSVLLNDISWSIESTPLDKELIENEISKKTTSGYDIYESKNHTIDCTLYKIKKVSDKCAVALKFDGYEEYYPCVNLSDYKPKTLQNLIDDLNLHDNLVFNCVYLEESRKFESPDDSVIWEMLLSDADAKNRGGKYYKLNIMGISIDIDVIGAKNISLGVNKYGYIQTNILGTAKSFYIGKDKVQAFVDYVMKNCKEIR